MFPVQSILFHSVDKIIIGYKRLLSFLHYIHDKISSDSFNCCQYLILAGDYTSKDIAPLIIRLFEYMANFEEDIPGASAVECGNYYNNNLPMAKYEAKKYLDEVLYQLKEENLNYPE